MIWLHWVLGVAHGILFPDQGLNPGPLHWELGVLATGPPGKSLKFLFIYLGCMAYEILVPPPGIEPRPLAARLQSLHCWTAGKVPKILI